MPTGHKYLTLVYQIDRGITRLLWVLLEKSRWSVLKRKENLTSQQNLRLRELLRYSLQIVRAPIS